jgi:hypothetical protein
MIQGFIAAGASGIAPSYRLYIHCAEDSGRVPERLTLEELKRALTFKKDGLTRVWHEEEGIPDEVLEAFLAKFRMLEGPEYGLQQANVIDELRRVLGCSTVDADILYYNNALRVVLELSTTDDENRRRVTRRDLLARISVRERLFSEWYRLARGSERFTKEMRKQVAARRAFHPQAINYIFISQGLMTGGPSGVAGFISRIVSERYPLGKVLHTTLPLTFVVEGGISEANSVKRILLERGLRLTDGWENIGFSPAVFDSPPVINRRQHPRGAGEHVVAASYSARIVSSETFEKRHAELRRPDSFLLLLSSDVPAFLRRAGDKVLELFPRDLTEAEQILSKN